MAGFDASDLSSPFYRPRYGFEGLLPQTGFSPFVDMLLQVGLPQFANTMLPGTDMRLLGVQGSLQQRMADLRRTKTHDAFMSSQRVAPSIPYRDMLLGVSTAFGVERTQEVVDAASDLGGIIQSAEPMLVSQMPGFFDQIAGSRGSEAVFREYMFRTSMMRRDPITGETDLRSVQSLSGMTDPLFERLFAGDNYLKADGLTAGQAGQFAAAAQARGLLPGLSAAEIQKALDGGTSGEALQNIDVTKIEDTLRKYAKTLTAIREVFADAGRPDAPMSELIAQMQAMAGQSLGAVADPTNLAKQIRTNYSLATRAGLSFEGMQQVQEAARQQADAVGLGPMSDLYLSQFSLSNRVALQTTGLLDRGMTNMTAEQLLMQEQTSLVSAADSKLLAYAKIIEEDVKNGLISEDDANVKQFRAALDDMSGKTLGPNGRQVFRMQDADFLNMYSDPELRNSAQLRLTEAANEYSRKDASSGFVTSRKVLRQQYNEYVDTMGDLIAPSLGSVLPTSATDGLAPDQIAAGLKSVVTDYLTTMSTEEYGTASREKREQLLRDAVRSSLQTAGMTATDEDVTAIFSTLRPVATATSRQRYGGLKPEDMAATQQFRNSREAEAVLLEETRTAELSGLLTESFGEKSPLRRLSDSLAAVGSQPISEREPDYLNKLVVEQLGGVRNEELRPVFEEAIRKFDEDRRNLEAKKGTMSDAEYQTQLGALRVAAGRLAQMGEGLGIGDRGIREQKDVLKKALQAQSHYDSLGQGLPSEEKNKQDAEASTKRLEAYNSLLNDSGFAERFGQAKYGEVRQMADAERGFGAADASTREKTKKESVDFLRQLYALSETDQQFAYLGEGDRSALQAVATKAIRNQEFGYSSIDQLLKAETSELERLQNIGVITPADREAIRAAQEKRAEAVRVQEEYQRTQSPLNRLEAATEAILGEDISQQDLNKKLAGMDGRLAEAYALVELEKAASQTTEYRKILNRDGYEAAEKYRKEQGLSSGFVMSAVNEASENGKIGADQPVDYSQNLQTAIQDLLKKTDSKEKTEEVKLNLVVGELVVRPDGSAYLNSNADMTAASRTA